MIKVYAAAVLIALIGAAYWRYDYVVKDRDQLKINYEMATAAADQYREKAESTAKNVSEYQTKLDELLNENAAKLTAVNVGTRILRIKADCSPTEKPTQSNTAQTATISDPALRQDIFDFRAKLILLEANYALCLKELD